MSNQKTLKSFLAAFVVTIVIAIAALVIALVASTSGTSADSISVFAGGVSQRNVNLLAVALSVVFLALLFLFRRAFR
jgi:hypothetical protein